MPVGARLLKWASVATQRLLQRVLPQDDDIAKDLRDQHMVYDDDVATSHPREAGTRMPSSTFAPRET